MRKGRSVCLTLMELSQVSASQTSVADERAIASRYAPPKNRPAWHRLSSQSDLSRSVRFLDWLSAIG